MLSKSPKSLFVGLSIAFGLSTLGLIVFLIVREVSISEWLSAEKLTLYQSNHDDRPLHWHKSHYRFENPDHPLGIYSNAAIGIDAPLCAGIAKDVLKRNGTAVDAAIAALFCDGVVHPASMGLGGGFIMTIFIKSENKVYSLMARETAPQNAFETMFVNDSYAARKGALAVAVPGELLGYEEAKKRFGNPDITWASLIEPSIQLCEQGVPLSETLSHYFKKDYVQDYLRSNEALRKFAEKGAKELYGGDTGRKLVGDLKKLGGILELDDLINYKVKWEEPTKIHLERGNLSVFSSPPPASGAILMGILGTLDHLNMTQEEASSVKSYQKFVETLKFAFAQRTFMADWNSPKHSTQIQALVQYLASEKFGRETKIKIQDDWTSPDPFYYGIDQSTGTEDHGTSHLSILASNGDAVSVTSTVNWAFGCGKEGVVNVAALQFRILSESTGMIMNNEMDDFSIPGVANGAGLAPSEANFIQPGSRPVSSMVPTIILDSSNNVRLVIGAAGGPKIITATAFSILQNEWFGRNIKDAINQPRLHHQLIPMRVAFEPNLHSSVVDYLKTSGHEMSEVGPESYLGNVVGVARNEAILTVYADQRKSGSIAGY
ncbi:hypothetical protein TCAL_12699 [Tigriopus californicus]|uniref:Gamma-glutamyltransferase n=1 Tax=Tigriopus californicus TaxID=6832 RepID=A0A553PDL9_TIGCA|nr:hypothetical protein TCAL_12699 [Tigriopus californicus]